MRTVVLVALLGLMSTGLVGATLGVDFSMDICNSGIDPSTYSCLVSQQGNSFAIIEAWMGGYLFDNSIGTCVANAWNAGFSHVDVYAFMCNNCYGNTPASDAVSSLVSQLSGVKFGMLWFDIEQCDQCWLDPGSNCDYVQDLVSAAQGLGLSVGIYSSEYEWSSTVGDGCTALSGLPLWYAHYDDDPSFDDSWAYSFGGWTSPAMKQYNDGPAQCGLSVDWNWYPDSMVHPSLRNQTVAQITRKH